MEGNVIYESHGSVGALLRSGSVPQDTGTTWRLAGLAADRQVNITETVARVAAPLVALRSYLRVHGLIPTGNSGSTKRHIVQNPSVPSNGRPSSIMPERVADSSPHAIPVCLT